MCRSIQLLATPERFDGQLVRVIGYVHFEFEGNAVYLHREDFVHGISKNGLWVTAAPTFNDTYAILEGRFNAQKTGHMGLFGGSIVDVRRLDRWGWSRDDAGR